MIAFLIVTSIINLALGYALAVYLEHAEAAATNDSIAPDLARPVAPANSSCSPDDSSAPIVGRYSSEEATSESRVSTSPSTGSPEIDGAEEYATEMETDLLAGIADFRNQLAQLKGRSSDAAVPNPLPVDAVN